MFNFNFDSFDTQIQVEEIYCDDYLMEDIDNDCFDITFDGSVLSDNCLSGTSAILPF